MTDELTPKNYAFLLLLKKAGREITNTELQSLYGIKLLAPHWQALNGAGWVETTKSRTLIHRITRNGEKVLEDPEKIKKTQHDPLALVLPMFHDLWLKAPGDRQSLEDRIRSAYADLAAGSGDRWVSLVDLRCALADVSREDLDGALTALHKESGVRLEPEPDALDVGKAERKAALRIGGEPRHKLAIGMP